MFITVKYGVEGFHYWPNGNGGLEPYLANLHRHTFHFTVGLEVEHHDREVEFINLRRELLHYSQKLLEKPVTKSCEDLVMDVITYLKAKYTGRKCFVWVEEDGENGAFDVAQIIQRNFA